MSTSPSRQASNGVVGKAKAFVANIALMAVSLLVFAAITEISLRLVNGIQFWPIVNLIAKDRALLTTQTANEYHPTVGWVLRPGIEGNPDDPDTSFTIGEYGVRMNEAGIRPVPSNAVLAVGDSFTAGSEVGDRWAWPAQLERLLDSPVVNGAAGGWAADQIVLRGEHLTPLIEPHTVILSFLADDILRSQFRVYGSANKPWFSIDADGSLVHHNNPVPEFSGKPSESTAPFVGYFYLPIWVMDRLGLGADWRRGIDSYIKADTDPVAVSCKLLERAKAYYAKQNIRLLFVLQYGGHMNFENTPQLSYAAPVVACARELDIETVDTYPALLKAYQAGLETFKNLYVMHDNDRVFGHMSAAGNALVAELVANQLGD